MEPRAETKLIPYKADFRGLSIDYRVPVRDRMRELGIRLGPGVREEDLTKFDRDVKDAVFKEQVNLGVGRVYPRSDGSNGTFIEKGERGATVTEVFSLLAKNPMLQKLRGILISGELYLENIGNGEWKLRENNPYDVINNAIKDNYAFLTIKTPLAK